MLNTTTTYQSSPQRESTAWSQQASPNLVPTQPNVLLITCDEACTRKGVFDRLPRQEVLLLRTAGNMVPLCGSGHNSVAEAVENAITTGVRDVVICGHSCCKAVQAQTMDCSRSDPQCRDALLRGPGARNERRGPSRAEHSESYNERQDGSLPRLYRNLRGAASLLGRVRQNVITQMRNLEKYPVVARAVASGDLRLHGWVYLDPSGMILSYDLQRQEFVPLAGNASFSRGA